MIWPELHFPLPGFSFIMSFIRVLVILPLLLMLQACMATKAFVVEDPVTVGSIGSKTAINVIDERPKSDREHSFGSFLVTSSEYGVWTLGDDHFAPSLLELLQIRTHREIVNWPDQPKQLTIKLKRLIVQSNQQADLLQSVSTNGSLGPLGVAIAEVMHGKEFELDFDKTRPFVLGLIDAELIIENATGQKTEKRIATSKIENFAHHMDVPGRETAAVSVVDQMMDSFTQSIQSK